MDKQEYKILSEEIMTLTANEQFAEAVEIADRIDWRKVKSFSMLQKISGLYKINQRYDEALFIIGLAYERNDNSKSIVYDICDLYLEKGDIVNALKYMDLYRKLAPQDVGNYILKYRILEMEDASYEDRIDALEKIVANSFPGYPAEWGYQLAYMYHRIGLATKCVECCDKLISIVGNGPFVIKAMELKMLHAKLTPNQKRIYDNRNDVLDELESYEGDENIPGQTASLEDPEDDFRVKTIDISKFNTINLQKALADSMKELMGEDTAELMDTNRLNTQSILGDDGVEELADSPDDMPYEEDAYYGEGYEEGYSDEYSGEYSDGEYQEEYPEEYSDKYAGEYAEEYASDEYSGEGYAPEDYAEEGYTSDDYENADYQNADYEEEYAGDYQNGYDGGEAYELEDETRFIVPEDIIKNNINNPVIKEDAIVAKEENEISDDSHVFFDDKTGDIVIDAVPLGMLNDIIPGVEFTPVNKEAFKEQPKKKGERLLKDFEDVLSYDEDGQFKFVIPEKEKVEKQITGQMNLEDVLNEWEKEKKSGEVAERAEVKRKVLEKTGKIFEDYEEARKTGIIAQIKEEQKAQRRVLKNDLELKKLEDIAQSTGDIPKIPFDATAQLNKTYGPNIWDEVEKANEEERLLEESRINGEASDEYSDEYSEEYTEETAQYPEENTEEAVAEYAEGYTGEGEAEYTEEYTEEGEAEYTEEYTEEGEAEYTEEYTEEGEAEYTEEYTEEGEAEYTEEYTEEGEAEYTEEYTEEGEAEYTEEYTEEGEAEYTEEYTEEGEAEYAEEGYNNDYNTEAISGIGSLLEAEADKTTKETLEEIDDEYRPDAERDFSYDEQELFADFLYSKKMRAQILEAIDIISLAPYVGNLIITGDSGSGIVNLAKAMIKEIQLMDNNFAASRVAKISGLKMNQKDIAGLFMQLANGALIVEKAGKLTKNTLENITKALENNGDGIIVILTDTKKEIEKLIKSYNVITGYFNVRVDMVPMNSNALVEYAKKYAYSREYKIDEERAVLALHERISELEIGEHHVTTGEVENIVDRAILRSKRPTPSTFIKILVGKRYDYDDMIILGENDFHA